MSRRRRSTVPPEPAYSSFRRSMIENGLRWHAHATTILVSRSRDDDIMEAFILMGITQRNKRLAELVRIMDTSIDLAKNLAGYRRAFGSLPDGWFTAKEDGSPAPGDNEYLFVFGRRLAKRTPLGRSLRRVTGDHTTFVDLFLAVVYGRERYLRNRHGQRLPLPHYRDQSILALAISDFLYAAKSFWSNDDLFLYMNELEYMGDSSHDSTTTEIRIKKEEMPQEGQNSEKPKFSILKRAAAPAPTAFQALNPIGPGHAFQRDHHQQHRAEDNQG
ncbi:hypothetical protein QBC44DRAFT_370941 [Cladorrhinum sp. PSN332]|nr:hypothetical protein QBC44DRAFT_370941 [Cladorrhinum sp. PSN332]